MLSSIEYNRVVKRFDLQVPEVEGHEDVSGPLFALFVEILERIEALESRQTVLDNTKE